VGVVVRIIMERRGWKTTGKKGSLGVRAVRDTPPSRPGTYHNTGGLAFWFLRAERYRRPEGMPFCSVRERNKAIAAPGKSKRPQNGQAKPTGAATRAKRSMKPKPLKD
jgi:hypothetical protein